MNISQHINEWSKKILKEAIEEGYDPSKDEFKQSDELKGADDYEAAQEYEKWMKDREKIMKELAPKSANEGCCDEKEEASDAGSVPEDGEGGDKKPETPVEDPDAEKKITDEEDQEQPIDEGILNRMSNSIKSWLGDTERFWNSFTKDQKLWAGVVEQIKKDGKQGLKSFSNILVKAAKNNSDDKLSIKIRGTDENDLVLATNPIITDFKGMRILCLAKGDKNADDKSRFTTEKLEQLMKKNDVNKLGELSGITVVASKKDQKKGNDSATTNNSYVVTSAEQKDNDIILTVSGQNVKAMKTGDTRAVMFGM